MATQLTSFSSTISQDTRKKKRDNISSCFEEDEKIITSYSPSSSTNSQSLPNSLLYYTPRWLQTVINWIMSRDLNSSCSEEDEKIITTFLPSSSMPQWKHDVFLSFYGKDTRKSFTDHLYVDLKRKGILVFRDDERLERGKCISQELLQAIQESQYAIVIFSANYASSKWCVMELVEIVDQWEKKKNLTIIPIFYHVDPSDVRNQRATFAEAFATHERDPKVDIKEIDKWRKAFEKVGNIAGEHIHDDRYESTIIQEISGRISLELSSKFSRHDYHKFVGINSRVEEMMKLLDMESNDVQFVGIHGMGGVGKTTLAEIIYDRVSNCHFEGSSFISCIREKSITARDLACLQKELLSTIMQEEMHVWDHRQGIGMIMKMLQNKKVFIVLDDVDSEKQLTALAGNQKWFGPGSRVIITSRDSHLLITHKVSDIYEVGLLQTSDALQLFCLSAFNKTHPPENFKELSMDFVNYARGLPLALKVLGSFLFQRTMDAWTSARDKLQAIPNKEVMNILQISFDGLEESQQKLFLDLACFCHSILQWPENDYFKETYPDIDIEVLVDKSLISKSYSGGLSMHNLLKKMGQEIVRRQCPEEPGRRTRLFRHEDVFHVLKNDIGTDAIEVIVLDFCPETKDRFILKAKAFSKMRKLRVLILIHHSPTIEWRGDPLEFMPTDKLQFLQWFECPLRSWPTSFQPNNLTSLSMRGSHFKRLWRGSMVLDNLKTLNLSDSKNLIKTPDLTGAPNLEKISLSRCGSLCEVHPSIGVLKRLKILSFHNCECLTRLPDKFCLESLENLDLFKCSRLENFPDIQGDMIYMRKLYFSWEPTKKDLPSSFLSFSGLRDLYLEDCKNISIFPSHVICSLSSLERLHLNGWSRLEKFPDLSRMECLRHLQVDGTTITQIPSINLFPKSIYTFSLFGRKRMSCKSRDLGVFINDCSLPKQSSSYPTYDIGSPVYQDEMEGMLQVEALEINLRDDMIYMSNGLMIHGWSLGSGIPEWVHNKSNGASLNIELDGTMKGKECAIFMVCDDQQFHSPHEGTSCKLRFHIGFETDDLHCINEIMVSDDHLEYVYPEIDFPHFPDVCLGKKIVFWAYTRTPWLPNNLYKRAGFIKISITAEILCSLSRTRTEVKVNECGMHLLICPDDAVHGLGSDLDSYRQFYSAWNCGMTRNED